MASAGLGIRLLENGNDCRFYDETTQHSMRKTE